MHARGLLNINLMHVFCREAVVISVKNLSGFVSVNANGSWVCEGNGRGRADTLPDPVS